MKFGVLTLGCKVNYYESNDIILALKERGHEAASEFIYADFYIINTCSITAEADKKSRQMVARALKKNPSAKVIIIGCSSENSPNSYKNKSNVIAISGTKDKTNAVLEIVSALDLPSLNEGEQIRANSRARAYLKIQDGCNNFCSYCIVPYLRGRSRSREINEIVSEAQRLSESTEEIVITGINISAFGRNRLDRKDVGLANDSDDLALGGDLGDLVIALKDVKARKRLGSLECGIITREFLEKMLKAGFCDHFHLSLQSGSKDILKAMNRHYTPEEFYQRVQLIREVFPKAGITTDIITAFPGETDAQHEETIELIKRTQFSDIHVFPYSKRAGTKAAQMVQLDKKIADARTKQLLELKQQLKTEFFEKNIGGVHDVFIEDTEGEYNVGYTSSYIKVYSKAPRHSFLKHRLTNIYNQNGMKGELIRE